MLFKVLIKLFPSMFCEDPEIEYKAELKLDATPQEIFDVGHIFDGKYYGCTQKKCITIEEYNNLQQNVQRHFVEVPYTYVSR